MYKTVVSTILDL